MPPFRSTPPQPRADNAYRTMRRTAFILALILCAVAPNAAKGAAAAPERTLRVIDFEERQHGNVEDLPMHWSKVEGDGMPHYVNGRLSSDRARSGQYSFRFDLNGGSLVYRYEPLRTPVQPRAHYRVEVHVKTTPMAHARARLSACFLDADRRPIISSIRHSEPYAAASVDDPWKPLRVDLTSGSEAAYLAVELELLQPAAYAPHTLGAQALFPQDIHGTAWFDDVTISQVPRIRLSTGRPGNIFRRGEALTLEVLVSDRSTDDLAAQLVVRDAAGAVVHQRSGALDMTGAESLGPLTRRMRLALPPLRPGWYQATLVMSSRGQFVGEQELNLVLLADDAGDPRPDERFGIIATDLPFDGWAELPELLPRLGAGRVKLAVWSAAGDILQVDSAGFDSLLLRLKEVGITPTACLLEPPPDMAQRIGGHSWLRLLDCDPQMWQPRLAYMIARHANHLDRWQLGADGLDAFATQPAMRQAYRLIHEQFQKLVQKPDLAMPWPVWYELETGQAPATLALWIDPTVLPAQLPLYIEDLLKRRSANLAVTLEPRDRRRYGREFQIRDLAQRVVWALAAGAQRIDLPLPFSVAIEDGGFVRQPQELLMIIRTLTARLGGSVFRGRVPIADGIEAFLFDRGGEGTIVLWDRSDRGGARDLDLALGERARAVDLWGNTTPLLVARHEGPSRQVRLSVGAMPLFLVDVDGQLARLRASLAIDQPLIESSFRPHVRRIRFVNPYPSAISGTLRLKPPAGWSISPPILPFNVNPAQTFEREITIEFPYNSFAGSRTVEAEFALADLRFGSTTVPLTLQLGLSDVGMQTLAVRDGSTLLVQQIITNYGERDISYTAYCLLPGFSREERIIMNLAPGRTTIRLYRFRDVKPGPLRLRTGVQEMGGMRILNDEVEVP